MTQKCSLFLALFTFATQINARMPDAMMFLLKGFLIDPPAREMYHEKTLITFYDKKRRIWAWKNLKSFAYKGATTIDPFSRTYTVFSGATAEAFFSAFDFFYARKIQYRFQVDEEVENEYLQLLERLNSLAYQESDNQKQKYEEISDDRSIDWHNLSDQRENSNSCNSEHRILDTHPATEPIYAGS